MRFDMSPKPYSVEGNLATGFIIQRNSDLISTRMYSLKGYEKSYTIAYLGEYFVYSIARKNLLTIDKEGYVQVYRNGAARKLKVDLLYQQSLPPIRLSKSKIK